MCLCVVCLCLFASISVCVFLLLCGYLCVCVVVCFCFCVSVCLVCAFVFACVFVFMYVTHNSLSFSCVLARVYRGKVYFNFRSCLFSNTVWENFGLFDEGNSNKTFLSRSDTFFVNFEKVYISRKLFICKFAFKVDE